MSHDKSLIPGHRRALEAMADAIRPELHRYASRLMGSVIEGEDVVQDCFARAFATVEDLPAATPLRPWLFRIAHNRAIDLLRRQRLHRPDPIDAADTVADPGMTADDALAQREAVGLAISRFTALPIPQRSTVILKDVLGESLADIAGLLGLSVDAVKAHLARGRARLRAEVAVASLATAPMSAETLAFAELFNQRDWTGLRSLLAQNVRLNQAMRPARQGIGEVGRFFTFYNDYPPVTLTPAWLESRAVLIVTDPGAPSYFMWLEWQEGEIAVIHDHRYARYVMDGAQFSPAL